ncbi:alkaline phosphatase family protein (plasmid) [Halorussus salilacus]|uniref:alkaline phosphatase family protein n=1 Tax=Halorussus salilacus TaxID=2953750 RepID=UPI00209DFAF2|nr:alkaline phosphatase family protein [Halorussus salilacus]USZ69781.1 alkaline phosphatase family protein [Halorussus salilacus]
MTGSVYVFGFDGVPPELVERGIDAGRLPNFERMRAEGADGTTRSTVPPLSMIAWSSFATGRNPGNHGVYNFMLKGEGEYGTEFVDAETLREQSKPVWEYLDAEGKRSGVMNVMPGYPPSRTSGFHISDNITTPSGGDYAFPDELQQDIEQRTGGYDVDPYEGYDDGTDEDNLRGLLDNFFEIERNRIEVAKLLVSEYPCDFYSLVFQGPDNVLHVLGHVLDETHPKHDPELAEKYGDRPLELLERYDDLLGWVMERMDDEDSLVALSDHGHGPIYRTVNLNSWLYNAGYLDLESRPWTRLKQFGYNHVYDAVESVLSDLNLFSKLKMGVARTSGDSSGPDLAELLTISRKDIDWSETAAFTVASGGQIYLNTDDHDEGAIPPEKYDEVRERLRDQLLAIEHPDRGDRVIDSVLYGEDVYGDAYADTRPDLVCMPAPGYQIQYPQTMKTTRVFGDPPKTGSHTSMNEMHGIFYAWGGPVRSETGVTVDLTDFAPTACSLLDVPVPEEMDGDVRGDVFEVESGRERYDGKVEAKRAVREVVGGISAD